MKLALTLFALVATVAATQSVAEFINDNNVLNYALTLENLESQFYAQGLLAFPNDTVFQNAGYANGTRAVISFISGQEASHAAFITSALNARNWPAVPQCTYNFSSAFVNVSTFVQTLATIEALGTAAYDGAAGALINPNLLAIAAGIATIEAKHTSAINLLFPAINSSFPNAFEPAQGQTAVVTTASGYIVSCPSATVNTPYAGSQTVNSGNLSSYTWQQVATFREQQVGAATTLDPLAFYYVPSASNNPYTGPTAVNDFGVLQYALFLENLEATFYATFNASYNTTSIQNDATFGKNFNAASANIASLSIGAIAAHEAAHVQFLQKEFATGNTLNSKIVGNVACSNYNWTVLGITNSTPSFATFLNAAIILEQTGVGAYVGAIKYIQASSTAALAATIATVEGRHAAYLLTLNASATFIAPSGPANVFPAGSNLFPQATAPGDTPRDQPVDPTTVVASIGSLIPSSCLGQANIYPPPFQSNVVPDYFTDRDGPALAPITTNTNTGSGNGSNGSGTGSGSGNGSNGSNGSGTGTGTTGTQPRNNGASAVVATVAVVAAVAALL